MFHQVKVPERDRDFLRFLWFPKGNIEANPVEYRMTVHLFGSTSSPSCANKALQQTANDCTLNVGNETKDTLLRNFYVDDLLKSVKDPPTGVKLIKELKAVCKDGGFNLTKWSSNCKEVIDTIPENERSKELQGINLKEDVIPCERTLGVECDLEKDTFQLSLPRLTSQQQPWTRRRLLSVLSSVFDPMGLMSPVVLPARVIFQRSLSNNDSGWDDKFPDDLQRECTKWWNELYLLKDVVVPRWMGTHAGCKCQLHVFTDASNKGYGVVLYVRLDNKEPSDCTTLLYSRSRVAPKKKTTIPRLELTAATLGVKSAAVIEDEMDIKFDQVFFWTDSMLVLNYIHNKSTRFSEFVSNRISVIHEGSQLKQWRHVSGKDNPADIASRGINLRKKEEVSTWLRGPEFLRKDESEWPKAFCCSSLKGDDPEVKNVVCAVNQQPEAIEMLIQHYSSWNRLRRATAWLIRFKNVLCKKKVNHGCPTLAEMQDAESALVKYVQGKYYGDEIKSVESGKPIKKSSTIVKLDPFLENGVLKVGGRLSRSMMANDTKHPTILPKEHHLSRVILQEIHRTFGHCGRNQLVTELRKKYWIPQAVSAARSLTSKCVNCRRYQRKPQSQKMADLPEPRVTVGDNPFSCTGMDYFGPFEIKRGRTTHKRYGVIFTCLKTRAVHLEVAHSLTTDSCINAIRRFISRRGPVRLIMSDNGTNLIGAKNELKKALKELNVAKIQREMTQRELEWKFNPPSASHYGGVWERMIRSVRKVLYGVLKEQPMKLDDEGLPTVFCEVEGIVNSRPLTIISDSPDEEEPLTPNHFLVGKNQTSTAPGVFERRELVKNWRQVQYLTNLFWRRWSKEYLVMLQERQRWTAVRENLSVGDIVLICENHSPRGNWQLGRVSEVYPDQRGHVRSVKLKTKSSEMVRPIAKLVVLLEADKE